MVSWSSLASFFKLESFMRSFCSGVTRGVFRRWAIFSRSFCLKRAVLEGLVVVDICNVCGNDFRCLSFLTMCCGRQRVWWNGVFFLNAVVKGKEEKRGEGGFRRRYVRYGLEMCSLCSRQILDCGDLFAIPEIESCLVNVQTLCHACS